MLATNQEDRYLAPGAAAGGFFMVKIRLYQVEDKFLTSNFFRNLHRLLTHRRVPLLSTWCPNSIFHFFNHLLNNKARKAFANQAILAVEYMLAALILQYLKGGG